jgi:uncharacterized protein (DUF885 family)
MPRTTRKSSSENKTVRAFNGLAKDYYDETFERFPIAGGAAGIRRFNSELGRATPEVRREQIELNRRTLAALQAMPLHDFEGDAWLDRLTLRAQLIHDQILDEESHRWQRDPKIYIEQAADSVYSLLVRHADNLKPVAPAILSRLRKIPRYLDESVECLRLPVPLWSRLAQDATPGIAALFRSLPEPLSKVTNHTEAELKRIVEPAAKAALRYAARVGRLKHGPDKSFSLGREPFERLIRERLGLNINSDEATAAGHALADKLTARLREEAKKFHPRKSASEILADAQSQWMPDGKTLIHAYEKHTRAARQKFIHAGAMTFPKGDRLVVKLVPDFMMDLIPTAAYSAPGPLDPDQTGIFWVNDLSRRQKNPEAKRREIQQHFGLELTSAHEAYPGHHLQFIVQNRHAGLVRKFASHSIYYEGWTLWCEQMCVDLKISENPYLRLLQLNDELWRANRIIIDCGLHTGELSYAAGAKRLQENVGFTAARSKAEINWYSASPTIPMSYLLGKMELLRLKRRKMEGEGWPLRQFNDWVLSFGSIPWSWIEASGL